MRSLNAQLEYLLRRALRESGRQLRGAATASAEQNGPADSRADREMKS